MAKGYGELSGDKGIFCILIKMVVTRAYSFVQIP